MKNAITEYLTHRLALALALSKGRESPVSVDQVATDLGALEKEFGWDAVDAIHTRSIQMVGEVLGGDAAPAMPHMSTDPLHVVEADIIASRIVEEARRSGIKPARHGWREDVNSLWRTMVETRTAELRVRAAPEPVQQPPNLESIVEATVNRALDARALQVRTGPGGAPIPPMRYLGVWRGGARYEPGDIATHKGVQWSCALYTFAKPGTDASWQLTMKGTFSESKAKELGLDS